MDEALLNKIETLKNFIQSSDNIVFFGGAGVSTESGIPDFRSATGLFQNRLNQSIPTEKLVSHSFFRAYPDIFYDFYKKHLVYPEAKPNAAHLALAKLEKMGKLKAVITQNIDGLHQLAGSLVVYELHGSVWRNYCTKCGKPATLDEIIHSKSIPLCTSCEGMLKPDVVLYEEGLDMAVYDAAVKAIESCDMLIVGGSSLVVYPAAGLLHYYKGKKLVLINKGTTGYDSRATLHIDAPIGEVLNQCV